MPGKKEYITVSATGKGAQEEGQRAQNIENEKAGKVAIDARPLAIDRFVQMIPDESAQLAKTGQTKPPGP